MAGGHALTSGHFPDIERKKLGTQSVIRIHELCVLRILITAAGERIR
jgi:hypothetical protein